MRANDLDSFLAALPRLDVAELLELTATHGAMDPGVLEAARAAVRTAAAREHHTDDLDRLRAVIV